MGNKIGVGHRSLSSSGRCGVFFAFWERSFFAPYLLCSFDVVSLLLAHPSLHGPGCSGASTAASRLTSPVFNCWAYLTHSVGLCGLSVSLSSLTKLYDQLNTLRVPLLAGKNDHASLHCFQNSMSVLPRFLGTGRDEFSVYRQVRSVLWWFRL